MHNVLKRLNPLPGRRPARTMRRAPRRGGVLRGQRAYAAGTPARGAPGGRTRPSGHPRCCASPIPPAGGSWVQRRKMNVSIPRRSGNKAFTQFFLEKIAGVQRAAPSGVSRTEFYKSQRFSARANGRRGVFGSSRYKGSLPPWTRNRPSYMVLQKCFQRSSAPARPPFRQKAPQEVHVRGDLLIVWCVQWREGTRVPVQTAAASG